VTGMDLKCMDFEVEVVRPRGRPRKTWSEVTEKDCQPRQICNEDGMNRRTWRKLIKGVVEQPQRQGVSESFF